MAANDCYFGIDVGTGSARAILVAASGDVLATHSQNTRTFRTPSDARIFQQSTQDIWACISQCVQACLRTAQVSAEQVKGIGFDATCSLAVVNRDGTPVDVSPPQHGEQWGQSSLADSPSNVPNIVLWADHRAEEEANAINATGHKVLDYVGGSMSLEMEIPKTLWLKKHMPSDVFSGCHFYDLPDYLTFKATGSTARSTCSLVCKTSYIPPGVAGSEIGWSPDFHQAIGLGSLVENDFEQIGGIPGRNGLIQTAGQPVGAGLTKEAAADLGLLPGTAVGSGLIDAYAGWVGTVAAPATNEPGSDSVSLASSKHRLAAIAGTSTCYCVQAQGGNEGGIFVEGVWGPYKDVVFPGFWQNEGGQSSTGQLIDFIIETHPASPALKAQAESQGSNLFALLDGLLAQMAQRKGVKALTHLTRDLHIYPDLHGNRSPLADTSMKGIISGLTLASGPEDLALKYLATLEAIALQTRQIIEKMNSKGHEIDSIYMSGSQAKNATLMQLLADGCNVKVLIPEGGGSTAVVKGSAILGRYAYELSSGNRSSTSNAIATQQQAAQSGIENRERLWELMVSMTRPGHFVYPSGNTAEKKLLDAKYKIFLEMIDAQKRWKAIVDVAIRG
ncbi:unnamed protein product [Jaminaea pallidilutea]